MDRENETIDNMLEREKYRRIAERYRSPRNDRYRQASRVHRADVSYKRERKEERYDDSVVRFPLRLTASAALFVFFVAFTYLGGDNGAKAQEKVKNILNENMGFEDIEKTGEFIKGIGTTENIKVDEETLEKMEEDTFIPYYP